MTTLISSASRTASVQLFHGPARKFEPATLALPTHLAAGEVLARISLATICGSDLHTVEGRRSGPVPCVLGHEAVGIVEESLRPGIRAGQRITWSLTDSCGRCQACIGWHLPQKCGSLFKYGHAAMTDGSGLNGCYGSHILLRPGTAILPVPDELADNLVAPANCALATVSNVISNLPVPCLSALVQGAGLLGLYACAWLRHRGVPLVFCADVDERRLALVEEFGGIPLQAGGDAWRSARETIRHSVPAGVDLAIEVSGSPASVPQGLDALRPGGTYVWAGMVHPETRLHFTGEEVVRKCLNVRGVHNYEPRHLGEGLEFLRQTFGRLPYHKLVSPPLPLASLDEAFDLARGREWLRISVKP